MTAPRTVLSILVAALTLAAPSLAHGYEVASGWTAEDYSTGYPHGPGAGPVGLAFDGSGNLLVTDPHAGTIHKVPPGGGSAQSTLLRDGLGWVTGLAFDLDGRLYAGKADTGEVVELNPADGSIIRSVVAGIPKPVGIATDPVSGDLFVSNIDFSTGGIYRISNYKNGPGTKTLYNDAGADGLTFAPDGTLYAAGDDKVLRLEPTNSSSPGADSVVANIPKVDGIAWNSGQGNGPFLIVVGWDDKTHRVNLADGSVTRVLTGHSRGDLVTVGPDNCIYADLQDRVIKLSPSSGACSFSTPAVPPSFNQPADGSAVLGVQQRSGPPVADLRVKASAARTVAPRKRLNLLVTVRNAGPSRAGGVTLRNVLPRGVRFLATSSRLSARLRKAGCSKKRSTISCRFGVLARGGKRTLSLPVQVVRGSRWVNRASVRGRVLDPNSSNNRSASTTRVKRARRAGQAPLNAGRL